MIHLGVYAAKHPQIRRSLEQLSDEEPLDSSHIQYLMDNSEIFTRALQGALAVPDWKTVEEGFRKAYEDTKSDPVRGQIRDPSVPKHLSKDTWAISACSVDGQQMQFGDSQIMFR